MILVVNDTCFPFHSNPYTAVVCNGIFDDEDECNLCLGQIWRSGQCEGR